MSMSSTTRSAFRTTRRGVLAGGAGILLLRSSRAAFAYAANERLNLAIVGPAGYCAANAFMPAVHTFANAGITALCDVDQRKAGPQIEIWKQRAAAWPTSQKPEERAGAAVYQKLIEQMPPMYEDFRKMLDEAGKRIDAVVVATPDHTHAVASATALHHGKHVLCEKPLTVSVNESRALRELARKQKVMTSMGNQGTQAAQFRRGVELIREGAIGAVENVYIWFARGGANKKKPPEGRPDIPKELNWDLWLGPAKWREYHPEWIARTVWRDTSAGQLGNFGPHTANIVFMGLELMELWKEPGATIKVEAECAEVNRLSFPAWERMRWHVPALGKRGPVTIHWHQGPDYAPESRKMLEKLMRDFGAGDEDIKKLLLYAGIMMVGSKGAIVSNSHNTEIRLLPVDKFKETNKMRPVTLPASKGHYNDWMLACRGEGPEPLARFEYAATFNEFLMLGDVATRFPETMLEYEPVAGRIRNHAEANAALGYEYRKGWRL